MIKLSSTGKFLLILFSIILVLGIVPVILWWWVSAYPLNIWVMDKTVPNVDYREHRGLFWIFNHFKIRNGDWNREFNDDQDYFGFFPGVNGQFTTKEFPNNFADLDLIYIADSYGVYQDDFLIDNKRGTRSSLIYGGLTSEEINSVQNNLGGNTLIAEFNSMASPTSLPVRRQLESLTGIQWKQWMGRYFIDLEPGKEVPQWLINNYEQQYGQKWLFKGPGITLVSDDDQVVVLLKGLDIGPQDLSFKFEPQYEQEFGVKGAIPYYYWFEFMEADHGTEVLATYNLDVTESGRQKITALGLNSHFPAISRNKNSLFTSYYFAGDFADIRKIPPFYKFWGLDRILKWTTIDTKGEADAFFWRSYVPMMKKILNDVRLQRKNKKNKILEPSIQVIDGVKMVARTKENKMQVYQKDEWTDFFVKGMNLGAALPGRWFTEFPQEEGMYLRWLNQMAQMNINTVRVYTLLPPAFYRAFQFYNRQHPNYPLYLMQEIWPEENPEGHNYLLPTYQDNYQQEIKHVIDAIHGTAKIPQRSGRAYGEYTADVSPWLISYLVGRELESDEVLETNRKNQGASFSGNYLAVNDKASPTEVWLASSCDYVLSYEEKRYGWQHPVAIVSWPTLDPMEHDSEWSEPGGKSLESNDKAVIDINNIELGPKNRAGFFGAYHIYPNYPDFMNNEPKYNDYSDEEGRLRYGGYLREFMAQHKKYPALVAEFGLATGMGNAHASPDNYHHGGMTEEQQGNGIVRMFKAIEREGYMGGAVFEWMDEWAKKTWTTEPFMIPYERHVLWHNAIDPEQNYGLLAYDPARSHSTKMIIEGEGSNKHLQFELSSDESFLYMVLKGADFNNLYEKILIGIDTYDRQKGEWFFNEDLSIKASSAMEFLVALKGQEGKLLASPSYNMGNYRFSSAESENGEFEEIRPLINKQRVSKSGQKFDEIRHDASRLRYGSLDEKGNHWYSDDKTIYLRIPWGSLNVTDPSSRMVLDDERSFTTYPERDGFKVKKTEGFVVSVLLFPNANSNEKVAMLNSAGKVFAWDQWSRPETKERLKKSYFILKKYLAEK